MTLLPLGPNCRKDRNKMPPRRSSGSEMGGGGGAGTKYLEATAGTTPIVKSIPLREPPLYPVRLVALRCESADFLGARWKYLFQSIISKLV